MWHLKYGTNDHVYETETHSEILYREQICGCQRGDRRGKDWEVGISRCKLWHAGWVNKVLPYTTGLRQTRMENNTKKYICVCRSESLCCTAQINTTLEINYISIKRKKNFLLFWKCPRWLEDSWQVGNSVLRLQAACPYEAPQTVSPHPPGSGPGREVGLKLSPCPQGSSGQNLCS